MNRRTFGFFVAGLVLALGLGWVAFPRLIFARAEQPLRFSHKTHAALGSSCADCHPIGADGRFAGIPRVETCAACHAELQGKSPDEKRLVEEYVKPGREIPWLVYSRQPDHVRFPHAVHVKRGGIACERCHGAHGESDALPTVETDRITGYSQDLTTMNDCESCHARALPERTACLSCHK